MVDITITWINEVKDRAEKRHSHFFDDDTMRFFKSRLSEKCFKVNDDIYFITSEKRDHTVPRLFTVRKCDPFGDIDTIGNFQEYSSLIQAKNGLKQFLGVNKLE